MHQEAEVKGREPKIGKVNEDGSVGWRDLTPTEKALFGLYDGACRGIALSQRELRRSNRRFWASVVCNVALLVVVWFAL